MIIEKISLTEDEIFDLVRVGCKNQQLDSLVVIKDEYDKFYIEIKAFYSMKDGEEHASVEGVRAFMEDTGDEIEVLFDIDYTNTESYERRLQN